ncbi:hypothetical protein B0I12_000102 [Microbacterium hydrothermale]|uniref:DUF6049 family protein n=1 Tax=Microbacterium hydrothermale TaxID=857427 RepID=UPI0022276CBF|nr:DUF6049 family protein [Microbacterium hydrothermale]MCW2162976.1 hypothetical protein [Microbacterium hydrothermale]
MPRRPRTRRLLATLATLALALGMAAPATAAAAAEATPSPSASASPASLAAAPAANGILRPGDSLSVVATLSAGSTGTTSTPVALSLGRGALTDDAALQRWLSGDATGVSVQQVATGTVDATSSGSQTTTTLSVPATDASLAGLAAGVYPVQVTAAGLSATSVIVVPADTGAQTPIALVVPITAAPMTRGLLTANELAELTAVDGALSAQLDAVDGTGATLAVDPAIPAAIRVLGSAAPPTAVAWLQRLLGLPNDRFALQFGDSDVASQLRAGLSGPLAPTSLQTYMSAADFTQSAPAVSAASTPDPSPASTPGQPTYPSTAALLDIGTSTPNVYWPATGSAGSDTVAALGALGSADDPAHVLVPSTSVAGGARQAAASVGGVSTPVYDAEVSRALADAAGQNDATFRGASLAAAQGYLALARATTGAQPVLAVLDRGTDRSRVSLRATLGLIATAPGFAGSRLAAVASSPASEITLTDPVVDDARVGDVGALLDDEQVIDRFATILDQPELLTGRERAEVLQVTSISWTGDAARQAVSDHRDATRTTLDSVGILSSDFRLVSSSAPLRPWVRNDLPWPVTVVLSVRPDDARLRVQPRTTVDAQASANTRVEVPVEARIANGEVSVDLQLFSPSGEPIGQPQAVDVEVRAEWESIGLIVIIVLVVAFLSLGVVRTVARRRRAAAAPPDGAAPPLDGVGNKDPDADGRGAADPEDDEHIDLEQETRP